MALRIAHNKAELATVLADLRQPGLKLAFVPTMGALHAGHASLMEEAHKHAPQVVASIFVNPLQFGPSEDFDRYPRTLESDVAVLERAGVTALYLPTPEDMYPHKFSTTVLAGEMANRYCGTSRPGHFNGVGTVVTKLLLRVMPDIALFGEKDYQQLQIIKRVVADLDIPVSIMGVPTKREEDGLALSSRNRYLSTEERAIAPQLYKVLSYTALQIKAQPQRVPQILQRSQASLLAAGFTSIDYLELVDAMTLEPMNSFDRPARLLGAVWLGTTRLIDNLTVSPKEA